LRSGLALLAAASAAVLVAAFASHARAAAVPTTSCAVAQRAQADRRPDVLAGASIQVLYARASDSPDNFGTMASKIATDVATGNAWFLREDPTRAPRWDLYPFPGCTSEIGRLDIADVTLPGTAASYAPVRNRWNRIRSALAGPPFNFNSPYKKYLVYYDAPVEENDLCGQGGGDPGGTGIAVMYVQTCGQVVGDGGMATAVTFHELLHTFGVVGSGALHECRPPNDGHTCDTPPSRDIMYPFTRGEAIEQLFLDPGRDDYWGAGPIDARNSSFLVRLDQPHPQLTVAHAGSGGLVESDVPGVYCRETCASSWEVGTEVELVAKPGAGSSFTGWSGACQGRSVCFVTIDRATSVTATFAAGTQTLSVAVRGKGRVTSTPAGLLCPGVCTKSFPGSTNVRLVAKPAAGYRFTGWSGACRGKSACTVSLVGNKRAVATFARAR
jgi:Divergent InlB B-repeat domain